MQTIQGTLKQGELFSPSIDHEGIGAYYQQTSNAWSLLQQSVQTSTAYGNLTIQGTTSGKNVVEMTFSQLNQLWGITINAPEDAFFIFDIRGNNTTLTQTLNPVTFNLSGGIGIENILFNLIDAPNVKMSGGPYPNVLAPFSQINYTSGVLYGSLIADYLYGGGQVNEGKLYFPGWENAVATPEPSTYLILGTFLLIIYLSFLSRKAKQGKIQSLS